jgi:hypothetical protein
LAVDFLRAASVGTVSVSTSTTEVAVQPFTKSVTVSLYVPGQATVGCKTVVGLMKQPPLGDVHA